MAEMEMDEHGEVSRKKRHKLERNEITLNLVAMLDMSFNILIFFILAANFAMGEGILTAKMPKGGSGPASLTEKPPDVPLNIILVPGAPLTKEEEKDLQSKGLPLVTAQIRIEGDPSQITNYTELRSRLESLQKNPAKNRNGVYAPDNSVVIKPQPGTQWNDVVNAFNAAVAAQYSNVAFGDAHGNE